jgi:hypothetical protein
VIGYFLRDRSLTVEQNKIFYYVYIFWVLYLGRNVRPRGLRFRVTLGHSNAAEQHHSVIQQKKVIKKRPGTAKEISCGTVRLPSSCTIKSLLFNIFWVLYLGRNVRPRGLHFRVTLGHSNAVKQHHSVTQTRLTLTISNAVPKKICDLLTIER